MDGEKSANKNLDKVFDSRPSPGIDYMSPMPGRVDGELLVAFDKEDAGVADLSGPSWTGRRESKASLEDILVLVARCEPRAARLRPADATTPDRSVYSGSVEGRHHHGTKEDFGGRREKFQVSVSEVWWRS